MCPNWSSNKELGATLEKGISEIPRGIPPNSQMMVSREEFLIRFYLTTGKDSKAKRSKYNKAEREREKEKKSRCPEMIVLYQEAIPGDIRAVC